MNRLLPLVFAITGLVLIGLSVYLFIDTARFLDSAKSGKGTVVEIEKRVDDIGKRRGTKYYPVVEFTPENGAIIRFTSGQGGSSPSYSVGESVSVLYDPEHPTTARIDSFFSKYGMTSILLLLGTVFAATGTIKLLRGAG